MAHYLPHVFRLQQRAGLRGRRADEGRRLRNRLVPGRCERRGGVLREQKVEEHSRSLRGRR